MLVNFKAINSPKIKRNDIQMIKLTKTNKNNIFKVQNSTPKLPSIKKMFPEGNKTLLIKIKKEKNNNNSNLFFSTPKNIVKNNSFRNNRIKKINSIIPINSASLEIIKIPNIRLFHNKIMLENRLSCEKTIYKENLKFDEQKKGNYISSILSGSDEKKDSIKTGIYGPNNNIVSVIRAKMERLKYENEYKGIDSEVKELIKDEIMDAQVKLKRKPEDLFKKKFEIKSLCSKKIDQYRYLTRMNSLREINQITTTPIIVKDGQVMLKLINDAFDYFKINK